MLQHLRNTFLESGIGALDALRDPERTSLPQSAFANAARFVEESRLGMWAREQNLAGASVRTPHDQIASNVGDARGVRIAAAQLRVTLSGSSLAHCSGAHIIATIPPVCRVHAPLSCRFGMAAHIRRAHLTLRKMPLSAGTALLQLSQDAGACAVDFLPAAHPRAPRCALP